MHYSSLKLTLVLNSVLVVRKLFLFDFYSVSLKLFYVQCRLFKYEIVLPLLACRPLMLFVGTLIYLHIKQKLFQSIIFCNNHGNTVIYQRIARQRLDKYPEIRASNYRTNDYSSLLGNSHRANGLAS
jgi:hypothetical protein